MQTTAATAALARIARADAAAWGQAIEATTRATAAVLVAIYAAGLVLGAWVHRLSGALGALASGRARTAPPQQQAAAAPAARRTHRPAPAQAKPARAASQPRQSAPAGLEALTVRQLRELARQAGHRGLARSGRRADLLQALAA
jgi:hypothetical protein